MFKKRLSILIAFFGPLIFFTKNLKFPFFTPALVSTEKKFVVRISGNWLLCASNYWKELSFRHKIKFSNPYIFTNWWCKYGGGGRLPRSDIDPAVQDFCIPETSISESMQESYISRRRELRTFLHKIMIND